MAYVTIRELRNHGGEVVARVARGERLTITRAGKPVAELHPVRRSGMDAHTLLAAWAHLPPVDAAALRADLDATLDPAL